MDLLTDLSSSNNPLKLFPQKVWATENYVAEFDRIHKINIGQIVCKSKVNLSHILIWYTINIFTVKFHILVSIGIFWWWSCDLPFEQQDMWL